MIFLLRSIEDSLSYLKGSISKAVPHLGQTIGFPIQTRNSTKYPVFGQLCPASKKFRLMVFSFTDTMVTKKTLLKGEHTHLWPIIPFWARLGTLRHF